MKLTLKGKAWIFGDNLTTDVAIFPSTLSRGGGHDPESLRKVVMAGVDPDFPKKVHPGDIIVAGKRFGQGNPHVWGFYGIAAHGIGVVAESIARGGYRNAVTAGVPFIPEAEGITKKIKQGDELEVNFKTGEIKNITSGKIIKAEPLPKELLDIIEAGGEEAFLEKKFATKSKPKTRSAAK
ncbi:MAG: 3-isopropylmalate dehydratase [Dehalococcoidales bacterium]|nr:3-isopropylmalate dehydratase [Dehalococcoidales bacterium]